MREALAAFAGQRLACRGRVQHFGTRPISAYCTEHTVCLADIVAADGTPLAAHCWFRLSRRLAACDPRPGDVLAFTAAARAYRKKRLRRPDGTITPGILDYKLTQPAQLRKLAGTAEGSTQQ